MAIYKNDNGTWQKLQSNMELNGNRKVLMRNIWTFTISKRKNGKRKYRR